MTARIIAALLCSVWFALSVTAATVKGRVVEDQTGGAIPSADVRLRRVGDRTLAANPDTDGNGRFEASDLVDGEYVLEVAKSEHLNASMRFRVAGEANVTVRLVRGAVVSGHLTDATGHQIAGVVYAMPANGGPLTKPTASNWLGGTDTQSQYRIANLPPGEYQFAVSYASVGGGAQVIGETRANSGVVFYPDNGRPQTIALSGGEERHDIDFVVSVPTFYTITGKVELPDPKARFMVALVPVDQPTIAVATVFSLADGAFTLKGVPPGSYTLFATTDTMVSPSYLDGAAGATARFARMHLDVRGQNIEGLSLVSQPGPSVSLSLKSAGSCPRAAQVTLTAVDGWGVTLNRTVTLNADEPKQVPGLAPVRFVASVNDLEVDCFALTKTEFDAGGDVQQPVIVTLAPAGSIRGRLNSGTAAAVVLVPPDGPIQVAIPDAESRFSFTSLRPGKYRIAAKPAGDGAESRWAADLKQMTEIQVAGGSAVEVDLASPVQR